MISLTLECCSVLTVQWWHSPSAKIFWYQIFSLALRHSSLSCKWDSLMSLFLHSGLSLFKLKTPDDWGGVNILPEELENIQNWKSWIVYQHILGFIKQNEDPWSRSKLSAVCTMVSPDWPRVWRDARDCRLGSGWHPLLRLRLRAVTQVRSQESSHPGLSLVRCHHPSPLMGRQGCM